MKNLLNKKEAAERLRISVRTLDSLRQRGNLPSHTIGNQVRFDETELEKWALGRDRSNDSNEKEGGANGTK